MKKGDRFPVTNAHNLRKMAACAAVFVYWIYERNFIKYRVHAL